VAMTMVGIAMPVCLAEKSGTITAIRWRNCQFLLQHRGADFGIEAFAEIFSVPIFCRSPAFARSASYQEQARQRVLVARCHGRAISARVLQRPSSSPSWERSQVIPRGTKGNQP